MAIQGLKQCPNPSCRGMTFRQVDGSTVLAVWHGVPLGQPSVAELKVWKCETCSEESVLIGGQLWLMSDLEANPRAVEGTGAVQPDVPPPSRPQTSRRGLG